MGRIVVVLLLLSAACGSAQSGGSGVHDQQSPLGTLVQGFRSDTPIHGGSAAQRELLRRVLDEMGPVQFRSVTLLTHDREWRDVEPGYIEMRYRDVAPGKARDIRSEWQDWVVTAAFRHRSQQAGLPGVRVIADGSGASRIDENGGRQAHGGAGPDAVRRWMAAVLRRTGGRVEQLDVSAPDGVAVSATLSTSRPAWFLRHPLAAALKSTSGSRFRALEGLDLRVVDGRGHLVWESSDSVPLGIGGSYVVPRLAGCNPIVHSVPFGYAPPPCPSD